MIRQIDLSVHDDAFRPLGLALYQDEIFNLLVAHCSDGILEELRLGKMILATKQIKQAEKLFGHLKSITAQECAQIDDLLALCKNCVEIEVIDPKESVMLCNPEHAVSFTNLEKFTMTTIGADNFVEIKAFLLRHQRLKHLKLEIDRYCRPTKVFNLTDIRHCERLEHLDLEGFWYVFDGEQTETNLGLPHLKYLKITRHDEYSDSTAAVIRFIDQLPPSQLEHLNVSVECLVDCSVVKQPNRFTNLRSLSIWHNSHKQNVNISNLKKLQNLTEFELGHIEPLADTDFAYYLNAFGSIDTLTELTISPGVFDRDALGAICRFRNLRVLKLRAMAKYDWDFYDNWSELQGLDKLTRFECQTCYRSGPFISNFLRSLGSTSSLEIVKIRANPDYEKHNLILRTLCRFPNIRIFNISCSPDIDLNIIKSWTRLEQFKIFKPQFKEIWEEELIDLIECVPNLRIVKGIYRIDLKTYQKLIEICQRMNRQLIIELDYCSWQELPSDLCEANRHIVDVYFKRRVIKIRD